MRSGTLYGYHGYLYITYHDIVINHIVDGEVYAWGSTDNGVLGIGKVEFNHQYNPIKIPNLKNIVGIACGISTTLAFTGIIISLICCTNNIADQGVLYGWGEGIPDFSRKPHYVPNIVEYKRLKNKKIVFVYSGRSHVMVITGRLYIFNLNNIKRSRRMVWMG